MVEFCDKRAAVLEELTDDCCEANSSVEELSLLNVLSADVNDGWVEE